MNSEIFAALKQLEKERGIPTDYLIEKITQALVAAYKKDRDGYTDNVFVTLDENGMRMYAQKEVVEDVFSPQTEIILEAARKIDATAQLGDLVNVDIETKNFGRKSLDEIKGVLLDMGLDFGMKVDGFEKKYQEWKRKQQNEA